MQTISTAFKNVQSFSLILGILLGVILSHGAYYLLTDQGDKKFGMSNHMWNGQPDRNEDVMVNPSATSTTIGTPKNNQPVATNNYMMKKITSEKQFLGEMKLHHESAVKMSEQALLLKNLRPEVRALAKKIIATQSTEIKMITDWTTAWKY